MSYELRLIDVAIADGVATATIHNPPVNLIDAALFTELAKLSATVAKDDAVRVLVLKSADPEFFIAHFDVRGILAAPTGGEPERKTSLFSDLCESFRKMPKVTIAQIEGRAGGGGSELALGMDMRFGVLGRTSVSQKEALVGLLAGGGGTQRLPRLIGRGRALEVLLGCCDIDAETAERWGYLNRALPADQIDAFVQRLARRIAAIDPDVIAVTKESVDGDDDALRDGLAEESYRFSKLDYGWQSRDAELLRFGFEELLREEDPQRPTSPTPKE